MRSNNRPNNENPAFGAARDLLARTMAVGTTFFATGPAFSASEVFIGEFVADTYGSGLVGVAYLFWFVILLVAIFAVSTLMIATLINLLTLLGASFLSR